MKPEIRLNPTPGTLDPPNRLFGYAAKFNSPSQVMHDPSVCKGPFIEVIRPGAFAKSLVDHPDVRALYNHDTAHVLARTRAGTMVLVEDEIGLRFDLTLPDTQIARDVRELVRTGLVDGCSFGFFVLADEVELRPGEPALRTLTEVHVFEITPATAFPAYESSEVNLRSTRRTEHAIEPPRRPHLAMARARLSLTT